MLDAITRAVAAKGYGRVTVADVVGIAGVSRTTFYGHFADKEACFLAAYDTGCDALIGSLVKASLALGPEAGWREMLEAAIDAYLATLAADADFARTFLVDILGAGPAAVELRRRVHQQFVDQFVLLSVQTARDVPEIHLRALVGGIAELVHLHLLANDAETLTELAPVLVDLALAVFRGAPEPALAA